MYQDEHEIVHAYRECLQCRTRIYSICATLIMASHTILVM